MGAELLWDEKALGITEKQVMGFFTLAHKTISFPQSITSSNNTKYDLLSTAILLQHLDRPR